MLGFPPTLRLDAPTLCNAKIHNTLYYNYTHNFALCQVPNITGITNSHKTPKAQEVVDPCALGGPLPSLSLLSLCDYQPGYFIPAWPDM